MANGYGNTTQIPSVPYLTIHEYKNAPTAIDIDNLVFDSLDPEVQDAELKNVIGRASSWIDTFCNQVLAATTEQEQQRTRYTQSDGSIRLHPRYNPIVALTSFEYGYPTNMASLGDCSSAWIEDQEIIIPNAMIGSWTSQGPLSFGAFNGGYQNELFVRYTYVAGYANTVGSGVAGDDFVIVENPTGIIPGQQLTIYDDFYTENVYVANDYVFGSTTVTLRSPLVYDHLEGTSISALPPAIKEAAILVTTSFLKVRGDSSMTMGATTTPGQAYPNSDSLGTEIAMAKDLLIPYKRVR